MPIRRTQPAPILPPDTIAILLHGWTAHSPEPCEDDGGAWLDLDPPQLGRLWREHETLLRSTAREWGWLPRFAGPDDRTRFFAEHLAAGFPTWNMRDALA